MGLLQSLGLRPSPKAQANPSQEPQTYTGLSIRELEQQARWGDASLSSAALAAVGVVSRAFSLAEVSPVNRRTQGLTAQMLGYIGAGMVLDGEAVLWPQADMGKVRMLPCRMVDVVGRPAPETWVYWLEVEAPSHCESVRVPGPGVIHVRIPDPRRPWRGLCPLPESAARLARAAERSLLSELCLPTARVTEIAGDDSNKEAMREGLEAGGVSVLRASSIGDDRENPKRFEPARFAPAPDSTVAQIRKTALAEVFGAVGLSSSLFSESSAGSREAWRQSYRSCLLPLARLAQAELADKLGVPDLRLDLSRLGAADIQQQASAYRRLAGNQEKADIDPAEARRLAGLGAD